MPYFCARLLVVCLVDDEKSKKKHTCDYPFFIIKAKDEDEAFKKALVLGKEQETKYKNDQGQDVRWSLAAVEQIWNLGDSVEDVEVGSIMDVWKSDKSIAYEHVFNPENELPIFDGKP